jgi:hypothetical protein
VTFVAIPACATLAGVALEDVPATEWSVRRRQHKTLRQGATGERRQQLALSPAGGPAVVTRRTFTIRWQQLGALRDTVEEILAEPGPHTLALWRPEFLAFPGDGARLEFELPWPLATHFLAPPGGLASERFAPRVKVGRTGAELVPIVRAEPEYSAGGPGPGEVWFLEQGTAFKLAAAAAEGESVHARVVPLFQVFEAEETEAAFQDPVSEPRSLVLLER